MKPSEVVIPAPDVPRDPFCCPQCQGQTIILHGHVRYGYTVSLTNGIETNSEQEESSSTQFIDAIECQICRVTFIIMPGELHEALTCINELTQRLGVRPS